MSHDDTSLEELLRRRSRQAAPDPGAPAVGGELCGDPEMLAAYAEGSLARASRQRFESHLAACLCCQRAVVRLMRLAPQESAAGRVAGSVAAAAARMPLFRWRWALPALAGVALVGSFVYYERERITEPPESRRPALSAQKPADLAYRAMQKPRDESAPPAAASQPPAKAAETERASAGPGAGPGGKAARESPDAATLDDLAKQKDRKGQLEQQQQLGGVLGGGVRQQAAPALAGAPSSAAAPPLAPAPPPAVSEPVAQSNIPVESAIKKEAPPAHEEADLAAETAAARAQAPRENKRAAPAAGSAKAESALPGAGADERRYAQRGQMAQEKSKVSDDTAGGRRDRAASGIEAGTGGAPASLAARRTAAFGQLRKSLVAGSRRFALTSSNQLLAAPAQSNEWQPVAIPTGAPVLDFAISGEHLWVLLPGGRAGHSSNLGRTWDPPIETGAEDATAISFTSPSSGEIRTASGRRLRTSDGGETWRK